MDKYDISGMSCAACSARVEKAVSKVSGVSSCTVSLLTNSMTVEGTAKETDVISAVEKAGYGARKHTQNKKAKNKNSTDSELKTLIKRLIFSCFFLIIRNHQ